MALAAIGIVIGSIFAAKLSKYFVNMGLVTLGAIGMTLIVVAVPSVHNLPLIAVMFTLFGIFSGFLIVPLNAKIQLLASRVHLGIILAGNNFIQNIFMFSFLSLTTIFAYNGMNTKLLFYMMALVGVYLTYRTSKRYIVDTFWAVMQLFSLPRHKYIYHGLENIPEDKIKSIAEDCGFDNLESFYRAFSKMIHTTPAKYRRQHSVSFWNKNPARSEEK